ncbi:hypothetical protein [Duganella sp. BuS-21]|uniref:hypothetical protein n=1 Tax=Duganella sp. BuS-21 TaxID=2943848 RepID=UPI0035A65B73
MTTPIPASNQPPPPPGSERCFQHRVVLAYGIAMLYIQDVLGDSPPKPPDGA